MMSNTPQRTPRNTMVRLLAGLVTLAALVIVAQWVPAVADETPAPNYTWEGDRRLSTTSNLGAFEPALRTAGNGDLMIAYNHKINSSTRNPYYRRSTDGGATWSAPASIRNSSSNLRQVTLAFDSSNQAHAVWHSGAGLFHAAQNEWPAGSNAINTTAGDILDPVLAIGPDDVLHLVWAQGAVGSLHNIYHAYSHNGGGAWSSPVALATATQHSSYPNVVTDSSGNVHVVWEERLYDVQLNGFRYEIQYKKGTKTSSGYSWPGSPTVVSGSAQNSRRPVIAANGDALHLSYAIQESNEEQYPYYRQFTPGSGWSTPRDISNGTPVSVNTNSPFFLLSSIQICGNDVYLYYHGATELNTREQIWGATSANNWTTLDVVTDSGTRNINPVLVCLGGNLHLGFERVEQATVNHQIYYDQSNNMNAVYLPFLSRG